MLALEGLGKLETTTAFEKGAPLAVRIDALTTVPAHHRDLWVSALGLPVTPDSRTAAERLLKRSPEGTRN